MDSHQRRISDCKTWEVTAQNQRLNNTFSDESASGFSKSIRKLSYESVTLVTSSSIIESALTRSGPFRDWGVKRRQSQSFRSRHALQFSQSRSSQRPHGLR